jgi:3-oxoacyl-(acyl-carrier-protein) synthase
MKVVITGLGVITPLGHDVDTLWSALLAGHSAAREWQDLADEGFRVTAACRIADFEVKGQPRGRQMAIAAASVSFWAEALREGPGFVNPRDFPWTLANSPASCLAMRFNLQGPCYTLGGRADATLSAFQHAANDLASQRVDHALVTRFDALAAVTMMGFCLGREPVPEPQTSLSVLSSSTLEATAPNSD